MNISRKTNAVYGVVVLCAALFVAVSCAQPRARERYVNVTGTATLYVDPDTAAVSFGIVSNAKTIDTAEQQNNAVFKTIMGVTESFGIEKVDIQFDLINMSPEYSYNNGRREFMHYQVTRNVTVKIKKISIYEEFIRTLLANGVTNIYSVDFSASTINDRKAEVRAMAVKAAADKAAGLAQNAGRKLGTVISIEEIDTSEPVYARLRTQQNVLFSPAEDAAEKSIVVGKISVTAKLVLRFAL